MEIRYRKGQEIDRARVTEGQAVRAEFYRPHPVAPVFAVEGITHYMRGHGKQWLMIGHRNLAEADRIFELVPLPLFQPARNNDCGA